MRKYLGLKILNFQGSNIDGVEIVIFFGGFIQAPPTGFRFHLSASVGSLVKQKAVFLIDIGGSQILIFWLIGQGLIFQLSVTVGSIVMHLRY